MLTTKAAFARQITAATLVALSLTGCRAPFFLIQTDLTESARQNARDVTLSPQYASAIKHVTRVAVRAPDACANQNASEATGAARQQAPTMIKTNCGVEMAEVERSLVKRGYEVVSWKEVANIAAAEQGTTAVAAAKRLGAQVLFQVNSLEKVTAIPGQDARRERRFYKSNMYGDTLDPAQLSENTLSRLRPLVSPSEEALRAHARVGAMLDVNATLVESGQSVWFYRASRIEQSTRQASASALATFDKQRGWVVVTPKSRRGQVSEEAKVTRSAEIEALSASARSVDEEEAAYFALVRNVVDDFAVSFASGIALEPPPGVAPLSTPAPSSGPVRAPVSPTGSQP